MSSLYNTLKGGCSWVGVGLFFQAASDRMRGNDLKLFQERFRWDIRRNFLTGKDDYISHPILAADKLESSIVEVDQGVLVDSKLNISGKEC
ncbi:hypothetical protein WISP_145171 [Willisornis vidua]|uniref:Uncharacterized protein n=1 Tax=Willisornis vidua TaxID=1566151 RepID=A0ABQ9CL55_9PASS|nr:hypothetical protein WISP_145171 [Willisornis vidua]